MCDTLVQGITDIINAQRREERAVRDLWDHWFGEEGEDARRQLDAAEGDAPALLQLMDAFPDWAEPVNRLATHRFMEGLEAIRDGAGGARQDFEDSARLCLRVLRDKPWHFGALSGIVMVYAQMGNAEEANRWAQQAMPPPGPGRQLWRTFSKVLSKMTLYSKCTKALTFENFCQGVAHADAPGREAGPTPGHVREMTSYHSIQKEY
jgi:hypothetical protein